MYWEFQGFEQCVLRSVRLGIISYSNVMVVSHRILENPTNPTRNSALDPSSTSAQYS